MKFFRRSAPALVAFAVLLCVVPSFAASPDLSADSDEAGSGEVLTDAVPDDVSDAGTVDPDAAASESGMTSTYNVECSGSNVALEVTLDDRKSVQTTNVAGTGSGVVLDGSAVFADDPSVASISDVLTSLFGEYTPKTQTVSTYFDGQLLETTTEYVPGVAGMDMEWLASVALFGLVLFCLFRLLGGIAK